MPLRDHFRPPVNDHHSWDELHGAWPTFIAMALKGNMPTNYAAGPIIHLGTVAENKDEPWDLPGQDQYEVRIHDADNYRRLFAVVAIVSPSNKAPSANRRSFARRHAALLRKNISVVIVDVVTTIRANTFAEVMNNFDCGCPLTLSDEKSQYAVSLRVTGQQRLELWQYPLTVGDVLPTLPIWLSENVSVPLDLESSYGEACKLLDIS